VRAAVINACMAYLAYLVSLIRVWQVTAGVIANRKSMTWSTKEGVKTSNYFGSVTQASTTQIGTNAAGAAVHVPLKNLLPMVNPNDLVIGGWDISKVCPALIDKAMCRECDVSSQLPVARLVTAGAPR